MLDDEDLEQRRVARFWAEIDADDDPANLVIPDEDIYG